MNEANARSTNTWQKKAEDKLITYTKPTLRPVGPPWTRDRYNQIDVCSHSEQMDNGTIAATSDIEANVTSDHFPTIATFQYKLKKNRKNGLQKKSEKRHFINSN